MSDPRDPSGYSSSDLVSMGFIATPELMRFVEQTRPLRELEIDVFEALVVAGGQAPMFTFEHATELHAKFVEAWPAEFFRRRDRRRGYRGAGRLAR